MFNTIKYYNKKFALRQVLYSHTFIINISTFYVDAQNKTQVHTNILE